MLLRLGEIAVNAATGVIAAAWIVGWAGLGVGVGFPAWWATVLNRSTASVAFVMVLVIQHSRSRHTPAVQRQLDELIRTTAETDLNLIAVEEAPDDELQALASSEDVRTECDCRSHNRRSLLGRRVR